MTGWGQEGPLANAAGHDINYISITGALAAIGTKEKPVPPLNLVGDFGGGALYLVVGVLAALLEASKSGKGQVVDTAMCDGAASLMSMFFDMTRDRPLERGPRPELPRRRRAFLRRLRMLLRQVHLDRLDRAAVLRAAAPACRPDRCRVRRADGPQGLAGAEGEADEVFKSKTREDWCKIMEGTDICFAPVLTMAEAPKHPHMAARNVFVERDGVTQPAPAPRFSRTPSAIREPEVAEIGDVTSAWKAVTLRRSRHSGMVATASNPDLVRLRGFDASRRPGMTTRSYAASSTFSTPRRI